MAGSQFGFYWVQMMTVQSISAVTLAVRDMARSVAFYHDGAGIPILYGGPEAGFTSLAVGDGYLNLILVEDVEVRWWGRCILYVDDVDAHHCRMVAAGYSPSGEPADAPWRERYYHITDPDGHEISFARPLPPQSR